MIVHRILKGRKELERIECRKIMSPFVSPSFFFLSFKFDNVVDVTLNSDI